MTNFRNLTGMLLVSIMASSVSAAEPLPIPGGMLDPSISKADAYIGMPVAAEPPDTPACHLAKKYVDTVSAGKYSEMASLFTEDAIFLDPLRKSVGGRLSIGEFYEQTIGALKPKVVGVAYTGHKNDCMLELSTEMTVNGENRYILASIDHFTLDVEQGKFNRMIVFTRPFDLEEDQATE